MRLLYLIYTGILILTSTVLVLAQDNYEIRHINFRGNKALEDDVLLDAMSLKEVSFLEKVMTKQERSLYNQEIMDMDMQRLTRTYQSEGFLNVKATLQPPIINEKRQNVKLYIDIEEGEPFLVDSVFFRFDEEKIHFDSDSLVKRLLRKVELSNGDRFRDEYLNSDVMLIQDALKSLGYAYVKVDYNLDLKTKLSKTDIRYTVEAGPKSYVGKTEIAGNKHVSEAFIRKQLRYEEGELYNRSLLNETRQSLYQLQLFRVVSVLPQTDEETLKNPIDIKINVDEAPRMNTRYGAGYGTEDKFRTFLDFNYHGFLGGARRINIYLKHSALVPYSASLRWIQPQLFGIMNSTLELNPFITRNDEPGYNTRTYGINIPLTYQFNTWLQSSLSYYREDVEQTIEQDDPEFTDRERDKFPYNKSGVLLSTIFNNSNPQFSPERGVNLSAGLKINGYMFGGDFSYTRLFGEFRTYHKIGDLVIAGRVMAGGITSADSSGFIPVEDRFYSGGSNSVRGWNRSELGPKRSSGTPMGGKSVLEGNFELRYKLFWRLSGVAFLDAGNVWESSFAYKINKLAYAAGGGLRLETPIGPVRFDLGVPVWNEKKSPQFFISVGQAF